ncbi:hypothetical protein D187_002172 [Cystobacter fuscus DSM 2262]|uniref:Uncharacterized protein n=1 Tax=Cystobacter fuscus (strain ATCC 25194 / DSM 2262 / NBRC 100088 / M29) TaxID=1242864 RepID=S9PAH1_CYSF2|nr:hypothetical protein [Cystobacter fuscus]EPX60086.1 hypothetical protein D187_002172 [Cystobacter fuscus DSM 2262]
MELARHFERSVWLNPEPIQTWRGNTIAAVRNVVDMFPLTLDGLGEALGHLTKGKMVRAAGSEAAALTSMSWAFD